jgi:hypothetical protein
VGPQYTARKILVPQQKGVGKIFLEQLSNYKLPMRDHTVFVRLKFLSLDFIKFLSLDFIKIT